MSKKRTSDNEITNYQHPKLDYSQDTEGPYPRKSDWPPPTPILFAHHIIGVLNEKHDQI